MRSQWLIPFLAVSLLSGLVSANEDMALEPDLRASTELAEEAGYTILRMQDGFGSADRALLDASLVAPVMEALAPGRPYGFSFSLLDLDADGDEDVVIFIKAAGIDPPNGYEGHGAPVLVYIQDDGWRLVLESGAMAIGVRMMDDGRRALALVQDEGFDAYSWQGAALRPD